jgi:hypothetical protein
MSFNATHGQPDRGAIGIGDSGRGNNDVVPKVNLHSEYSVGSTCIIPSSPLFAGQ